MDLAQNWQGIEMLLMTDISQVLDFSWNTLSLSLQIPSQQNQIASSVLTKSGSSQARFLLHLALLSCSMHKATSSTQTLQLSSDIKQMTCFDLWEGSVLPHISGVTSAALKGCLSLT